MRYAKNNRRDEHEHEPGFLGDGKRRIQADYSLKANASAGSQLSRGRAWS